MYMRMCEPSTPPSSTATRAAQYNSQTQFFPHSMSIYRIIMIPSDISVWYQNVCTDCWCYVWKDTDGVCICVGGGGIGDVVIATVSCVVTFLEYQTLHPNPLVCDWKRNLFGHCIVPVSCMFKVRGLEYRISSVLNVIPLGSLDVTPEYSTSTGACIYNVSNTALATKKESWFLLWSTLKLVKEFRFSLDPQHTNYFTLWGHWWEMGTVILMAAYVAANNTRRLPAVMEHHMWVTDRLWQCAMRCTLLKTSWLAGIWWNNVLGSSHALWWHLW